MSERSFNIDVVSAVDPEAMTLIQLRDRLNEILSERPENKDLPVCFMLKHGHRGKVLHVPAVFVAATPNSFLDGGSGFKVIAAVCGKPFDELEVYNDWANSAKKR